jgi:hypothetical protein
MFAALKSRGYRLEQTHLTEPDRIQRLIGLLALAFRLDVPRRTAASKSRGTASQNVPWTTPTHHSICFGMGWTDFGKFWLPPSRCPLPSLTA